MTTATATRSTTTQRRRPRSYGYGYVHAPLWMLAMRWLGERYTAQLWRLIRWWGKLLALVAAAAAARWAPLYAGPVIVWATWAVTAYSDVLPARWPRWTVPASWSVLNVGLGVGLLYAAGGTFGVWIWLPTVGGAILAGAHRGRQLRALWRRAGVGADLLAAWTTAPWRWRAGVLVAALIPGAILSALRHPLIGAALTVALVGAAAARWRTAAAERDQLADTHHAMSRALAGTLTDVPGSPWEIGSTAAPVAITATDPDDPGRPATIEIPLPAAWQSEKALKLDAEVRARLRAWGEWAVIIDPSTRRVEARAVDPLPERITWDGTADLSAIRIGVGRVPPAATEWDPDAPVGAIEPAIWRPELAPHLLVVGATGAGKSVAARVLVGQWTRGRDVLDRPGRVTLLDPKQVEFTIFRGRTGVDPIALDEADMDEALTEAVADMRARMGLLARHGRQHVDELPPDDRPERRLVVVDEAAELLDTDALDEEEREQRRRIRRHLIALTRLGRAAAMHVVILAQRPDAEILTGRLRHNLQARALFGPSEPAAVRMTFGESAALPGITPGVRGRGRWTSVGEPAREIQGLWVSVADLDTWCPRTHGPGPSPTSGPPALTDPVDDWMAGHGIDPTIVAGDPPTVPLVRTI